MVNFGIEGSHWYIAGNTPKEAMPFYEVPYADASKGMRKCDIRDARKVGARPSVTTIQKIEAKEAIVRYRIENALMSALTSPIQKDIETDDQYIQRIINDAKDESRQAMDKGTEIHQQIFNYYENKDFNKEYTVYVKPLVELVESEGVDIFKHETCFCNGQFGGRIDCDGYKPSSSMPIIIDWKSQNTKKNKGKFTHYPEHGEQLAAYANGIGLPDALLYNFYTSSDEPGRVDFFLWKDNDKLYQNFLLLYKLWCSRNDFDARI
jgi:hypothetical protein